MIRILVSLLLLSAFAIWLAEKKVRRMLGLRTVDNCATWAVDHFDYDGGDGVLFHRTVSNSRIKFPHVVIVRGARQADRRVIDLVEFIPKVRDMDLQIPPRYFDGHVKRRRYEVCDSPTDLQE